MRQLIRAALRGLGVTEVFDAEDGVRALEVLDYRPIDLVLLDAEMPRMDGIETLRAIRASAKFGKLPVIMVTGRANAEFVRDTKELGVSGYLLKPVTAAALGARIDAITRMQVRPAS